MVSQLSKGNALTIQDLLQLPRPSGAVLAPNGRQAIWPSSSFSFEAADGKGRTTKSLYLVDLDVPKSTNLQAPKEVLTNLTSLETAWVDERTVLFLRPSTPSDRVTVNAEGQREDHPVDLSDKEQSKRLSDLSNLDGGEGVELWAKDITEHVNEEYLVGRFPVPIANLTATRISSGKEHGAILTFSANVFPDGDIYKVAENKARVEKEARGSDVRVYDSLFVRHWDEWSSTEGEKEQLHFVRLTRNPDSFEGDSSGDEFEHVEMPKHPETEPTIKDKKVKDGKWTLVSAKDDSAEAASSKKKTIVKSPLAGLPFECPVGPFGSSSDFSVSSTHLVFHAKDPEVNPAWHTRTNVYLLPLSPRSSSDAKPTALTVGTQGACSSPVFSRDGKRIAWLEMREDGYEADRNRVMIYELESGKRWAATEKWDRSPSALRWCPCGEKLYMTAEEGGFNKLFQLPVPVPSSDFDSASLSVSSPEPEALTHDGSVTAFSPNSTSSLIITSNSLTSPNVLSTLSISAPGKDEGKGRGPHGVKWEPLATLSAHLGENKELSEGESFYFAGANSVQVHGFILFPPGFKDASLRKGKKFALAFLVHGGPQGAWTDSWSTRWNPNIYAAHGYITVAINPTGSTGYGQEFCDAIKSQWGGLPYQDLVAGLEFVQEAYPEIDADRKVMLGASYGGFMANWIQGHNERTGFKAIVCHDGVFSTSNVWYTTEELYFPTREFGGAPWENPEGYSKWCPTNHIQKWKTPQLIIHGGRDYRLLEGEGIAAFNTLQRLGVPSRFVYFGSENHWVLNAQNGVRWHEEVLKWIDEWTSTDSVVEA